MKEDTKPQDDRDGIQAGLTVAPQQVIGYVDGRAVLAIAGGASDDDPDVVDHVDSGDDNDDDDDSDIDLGDGGDDDDDDDNDDDDEKSKPKPPAKKAAPTKAPAKKAIPAKSTESKLELALRREREARKSADSQLRALRQANESEADKRQREAEEAAEAKYKPGAVRAAARAALVEAKIKGGDPTRGVRLIDLDAVDFASDGEVIGLEDQIEFLKKEYPEMFDEEPDPDAAPRRPVKRAAGKIDGAGRRPVDDKPKSSAERIAQMVLSGRSA